MWVLVGWGFCCCDGAKNGLSMRFLEAVDKVVTTVSFWGMMRRVS